MERAWVTMLAGSEVPEGRRIVVLLLASSRNACVVNGEVSRWHDPQRVSDWGRGAQVH